MAAANWQRSRVPASPEEETSIQQMHKHHDIVAKLKQERRKKEGSLRELATVEAHMVAMAAPP
jgi:hypothetical protein